MVMKSKVSTQMVRYLHAAAKPVASAFQKLYALLERFAPMGYQDESGFHLDARDRFTQ